MTTNANRVNGKADEMTEEITGTYGGSQTPCSIFVYDGWYAVEGSVNVNLTDNALLVDGVDVELLGDYDCFTWNDGIHSEEDIEKAVTA